MPGLELWNRSMWVKMSASRIQFQKDLILSGELSRLANAGATTFVGKKMGRLSHANKSWRGENLDNKPNEDWSNPTWSRSWGEEMWWPDQLVSASLQRSAVMSTSTATCVLSLKRWRHPVVGLRSPAGVKQGDQHHTANIITIIIVIISTDIKVVGYVVTNNKVKCVFSASLTVVHDSTSKTQHF